MGRDALQRGRHSGNHFDQLTRHAWEEYRVRPSGRSLNDNEPSVILHLHFDARRGLRSQPLTGMPSVDDFLPSRTVRFGLRVLLTPPIEGQGARRGTHWQGGKGAPAGYPHSGACSVRPCGG